MPATLIDYAIAAGLMIITFAASISFVASAASAAHADIKLATLQLKALSLSDLANREYAFDESISGLGLATRIANAESQPPTEQVVVSSASLHRLALRSYSDIREDFDFRIRILDANTTVFEYGSTPPLADVVALQKPVLYESSGAVSQGTFIVEVWQ